MTTLTIYSDDFDDGENVVNDGFSGCVFLDEGKDGITGTAFGKLLSDALVYIQNNNIEIDCIEFNYRCKNEQMFKRFFVKKE